MDVLSLLDRPIAYHRIFVTLTGSVTAAVLLSQAVYWSRRTGENGGWFWKTAADWTEETGLTRREQETARAILRELGFWQEEKRGIPARLWFFLDVPALETVLRETSMAENAKQAWRKPPIYFREYSREYFNLLPGGGRGRGGRVAARSRRRSRSRRG